MGRGMVHSLIRNGHSLKIYNRTRAKAEEAAQSLGTVVDSAADAAADADVLVTMLADPAAVLGVLEGEGGYLSTIRPGTVVIDSSTISPPVTLSIAQKLKTKGAEMLDAPVFGSKNEAEKGELGFIVGGDPSVFKDVQDVFNAMGKTFYVGTNGMGSYAKLVVNFIIAASLQAMNEGMVLATKAGLNPDVMMQIIQTSRARSGIIEMKAPQVLKRDFSPFFPLRLMDKDLGLVMDTAHSLKVPMMLGGVLKEVYSACMAQGLADEDFCATIKLLEGITQVEVKGESN
jgi:3-hydroxyisobutyrate dehydrogenase/2-hydroxy-3-oxopropionate reductase